MVFTIVINVNKCILEKGQKIQNECLHMHLTNMHVAGADFKILLVLTSNTTQNWDTCMIILVLI